ncbi:Maf family protein [Limnohabitans sp. TEGF004]|jgi:septum formation protein|uniref:Maf family protein n=1 Tax=Limnohabitans sp. TEGF004 TaxID=2986281 RepID=UPI0023776558|nr:Maf family protein [Limnohabitans sp. TEGF004]BDU55604.1 Maf-like protein [Limnohabitans sp. TEGF004]
MSDSKFVYLASQSPRRRQLLEQLGVRYELLLADEQEDAEALEVVLPNEAPRAYVQRVTLLKLEAALNRMKRRGLPLAPVLCSDTTVALGKTILGKPDDTKHAAQILGALSGQTHRVLTSVAMGTLSKAGKPLKTEQALSVSNVRFAALTRTQIQNYVASGEPMGKAGAYAVQGRAAAYIEHISGSYSGIMGLPMFETAQLLREFGFKV